MGIGYLVAVSVLVSEIVGGCAKRCRQIVRRNSMGTFLKSGTAQAHPNTSNRASFASSSGEKPLSSQERFRRLVLSRFRRNSEQLPTTIPSNEAQDHRKRHIRSESISALANPDTSSGVDQLTFDERWDKIEDETDIQEIRNHNGSAEYAGSANRSNHATANVETDQAIEIMSQDASYSEEFGEIVEHRLGR